MKQLLCCLQALIIATIFATGCTRSADVKRVVTPQGELLSVEGKYTLILISDKTMRQTFGSEWHRLNLFYGSNRAITLDGERSMVTGNLRPLAKGSSILLISGSDWRDLIVPVYALETRKQATFYIDTVEATIKVEPPQLRRGEPTLSPEGQLFFR